MRTILSCEACRCFSPQRRLPHGGFFVALNSAATSDCTTSCSLCSKQLLATQRNCRGKLSREACCVPFPTSSGWKVARSWPIILLSWMPSTLLASPALLRARPQKATVKVLAREGSSHKGDSAQGWKANFIPQQKKAQHDPDDWNPQDGPALSHLGAASTFSQQRCVACVSERPASRHTAM